MPNRVLRDYTNSEKINNVSWQAECLFVRLMMKADDFGSFHGNVKIIKANCFPLRTDTVRDADISRWMDELLKSGLIVVYTHAGKQYMRISDFKQRLRNMTNKFPDPPPSAAICGNPPPETEEKPETETETEGEKKVFSQEKFLVPEMMKEWKKVFKNYPDKKDYDFPALLKIAQFIAEKQGIDCDIGLMPLFKQLSEYISRHDFYKNYSLMQVSKHIQNIVNSINNGELNSKTNGKSDSKNFRQQVNEAFAKRNSQQPR